MPDFDSTAPARAALFTAFALVYLIWGATYLVMKFAVASMPPLLMAGSRYTVAGGLLYGFMRLCGAPADMAGIELCGRYWAVPAGRWQRRNYVCRAVLAQW